MVLIKHLFIARYFDYQLFSDIVEEVLIRNKHVKYDSDGNPHLEDDVLVQYIFSRVANMGNRDLFNNIKEKLMQINADTDGHGAFGLMKGSQNIIICIHSFIMMEDYSNPDLLSFLFNRLLETKNQLERFSMKEKSMFNRTLLSCLLVVEIDKEQINNPNLVDLCARVKKEMVQMDLLKFENTSTVSKLETFYHDLMESTGFKDYSF
jgi:hypothetical protein